MGGFFRSALACILVLAWSSLWAQAPIELDMNDMPQVGDRVLVGRYNIGNGFVVPFNYTQTGPNQTWDFRNLDPQSQDTLNFNNFLTTPYGFLFIDPINFFGTLGVKQPDQNIGLGGLFTLFQFTNVYEYQKRNIITNQFEVVGRGQTAAGAIPLLSLYEEEDVIFKFPVRFGDSIVTPFRYNLLLGLQDTAIVSGTRTTVVDGWGTVRLPIGDVPALKVRSRLVSNYNIRLNTIQLPIPVNFTLTENEYKWIGKQRKAPLLAVRDLQVIGIGAIPALITDVYFQDIFRGPTANFQYLGPNSGCRPFTVQLQDQTFSVPDYDVLWEFGDGNTSTQPNPTHTYQVGGTYNIRLTATNKYRSDTRTLPQPVVVDPFTVRVAESQTPVITAPRTNVQFTNASFPLNQPGGPYRFTWDFGNGYFSNDLNPSYVYRFPGSYTVKLVGENPNGCRDSVVLPGYVTVQSSTNREEARQPDFHFWPNPAREQLDLEYWLPTQSEVNLALRDVQGRQVWQSEMGLHSAGAHRTAVQLPMLPEGLYILQLNTTVGTAQHKLVIR
jgi:PKD repeat protein